MMPLKDLCLTLINCESEDEVIEILKKEGYWDDSENWRFFGSDENNYSIIGNQQSKPETAIVEKIINSVDAMLMGECLKRKIKPESDQAPQSIKDALVKFFNIHDGKLTNIPAKERSKLSDSICFVATGQKTNPTYALIEEKANLPQSCTILSCPCENQISCESHLCRENLTWEEQGSLDFVVKQTCN